MNTPNTNENGLHTLSYTGESFVRPILGKSASIHRVKGAFKFLLPLVTMSRRPQTD